MLKFAKREPYVKNSISRILEIDNYDLTNIFSNYTNI